MSGFCQTTATFSLIPVELHRYCNDFGLFRDAIFLDLKFILDVLKYAWLGIICLTGWNDFQTKYVHQVRNDQFTPLVL